MATVRFSHVTKKYGNGYQAVSDFNLHIKDRELVVLVGPSGCGKSTTMRMVAGLEEVSSGTISIGDRVVNDIPAKDRNIAMVFQDYALYPHMTVEENMSLGLKLKKVPRDVIQKKVSSTAEVLGLHPYMKSYPRQLSGGQRQRVALGRAIVRTPEVFMFDEPLSNLDPKLRTTMRVEIKRLHQQLDATMIYVTHDQIEAMTLGDQIVVMDKGVMQQVADPITLYDSPRNQFVGGFIGTPPMNFFLCHLKEEVGVFFVEHPGFRLRVPDTNGRYATLRAGFPGAPAITLGVRAEDFQVVETCGQSEDCVQAYVDVVEPLGAEALIHVSAVKGSEDNNATTKEGASTKTRFVVRDMSLSGVRHEIGSTACVKVNVNKLHLFNTVDERAIV